ncbi:UDP-N-acetylmuramyl-tripeptide synthetase [Myxococcota bacterium]|nr:UDP-N-acetylmuramyl-tripeptide synthetase [Myxococcota bacterium]
MSPPGGPPPRAPEATLVGITGTNGKTTTTLLVSHLLRATGQSTVVGTTVGAQVAGEPTPVSAFGELLRLGETRGVPYAVFEVTSRALAGGLSARAPFDAAVLTNFTRDHLETHATPEAYLAAKAALFATLGRGRAADRAPRPPVAVLNGDDPASALVLSVTPPRAGLYTFGFAAAPAVELGRPGAHLWAEDVRVGPAGTAFTLHAPGLDAPTRVTLRLAGRHMVQNTLAALAVLSGLGRDLAPLLAPLSTFTGAPGRFERVPSGADDAAPAVFVDYAHTPDGLRCALETARAFADASGGAVWLVFGAPGGYDPGKRPEMGAIAAALADRVVVTTDNPRDEDPAAIAEQVVAGSSGAGLRTILDRGLAITTAITEAAPADVVLIAGKGHERVQIVRGVSHPFVDADVAARALSLRR